MEKVSARRCGGAARARIIELAGVAGPYPRPRKSAPRTTAQINPLEAAARPKRHSKRPICETRIGPKRADQPPAVAVPIIEPTYTTVTK
jgi:hypothetical protein